MPALSMPIANTVGLPEASAKVWSWWIGLKSPEAPAYFTKLVRASLATRISGRASPSSTSSQKRLFAGMAISLSVIDDLAGLDADGARAGHQRALGVAVLGLRHREGHGAAALARLLVHVDDRAHRGQHVAGVDGGEELELLLAVQHTLEVEGQARPAPPVLVPVGDGLQERHRRHDAARLLGGVALVEVQRIVVLDRARELLDLAALDVHGHGLARPAPGAPVDRHRILLGVCRTAPASVAARDRSGKLRRGVDRPRTMARCPMDRRRSPANP